MMEITQLDRDITALCVSATAFPEGVLAAHQKLHSLVTFSPERNYFGISYPVGLGQIMYLAATEIGAGEDADALGCDVFFIKKGQYISTLISDFMQDIPAIGRCFQTMLEDPRIDPNGYCLEWYQGEKDVRCMVRLAD